MSSSDSGWVPPGWYPDPSGEHELRYFDGQTWTEHVSGAHLGPGTSSGPTRSPSPFVATGLTWRARHRPLPTAERGLGAAGGTLVGLGAVGFGAERLETSGSSSLGIAVTAALVIAGVVGAYLLDGALRSSSITMLVVGISSFWVFVTVETSIDQVDTGLLFAAGTYALVYVVGPARSHGPLLGAALVAAWAWALIQTADTAFLEATPSGSEAGAVSLFVGTVYVLGAIMADRRALRSVAAIAFAVGSLAIASGAFVVGGETSAVFGGLIALGFGCAYLGFGARHERRCTAWIGAVGVAAGLATLASSIADDGEGNTTYALLVVAGVVALAVTYRLQARLGPAPTDAALEARSERP